MNMKRNADHRVEAADTDLVIREAALADIPQMCELAQELAAAAPVLPNTGWPEVLSPSRKGSPDVGAWVEGFPGSGCTAFVAEAGGCIAGFVSLSFDTSLGALGLPECSARIHAVCVAPWALGDGVTEALLSLVEAWAEAEGASEMQLELWAHDHRGLQRYEELGYQPRSKRMAKFLGRMH